MATCETTKAAGGAERRPGILENPPAALPHVMLACCQVAFSILHGASCSRWLHPRGPL